jgi:hypothetical protein
VSYIEGNKESNNAENTVTITISSHVVKIPYSYVFLFFFSMVFVSVLSIFIISVLFVNLMGFILLINSLIWAIIGIIMVIIGINELR